MNAVDSYIRKQHFLAQESITSFEFQFCGSKVLINSRDTHSSCTWELKNILQNEMIHTALKLVYI